MRIKDGKLTTKVFFVSLLIFTGCSVVPDQASTQKENGIAIYDGLTDSSNINIGQIRLITWGEDSAYFSLVLHEKNLGGTFSEKKGVYQNYPDSLVISYSMEKSFISPSWRTINEKMTFKKVNDGVLQVQVRRGEGIYFSRSFLSP